MLERLRQWLADRIAPHGATREPRNAVLGDRENLLATPSVLFSTMSLGTESGQPVSIERALYLASVWQAVSIISGDVAQCTLRVYRDGDDRRIDTQHRAYTAVARYANPITSAYEFWRRIVAQALLHGNGYAAIVRNGKRLELFNIDSPQVTVSVLDDGDVAYTVRDVNGERVYDSSEILHIKGLSLVHGTAHPWIICAKETIGLALAAQTYAAKFFANGAQLGGVIEMPSGWSQQTRDRFEENLRKKLTSEYWFRFLPLADAKFHMTSVDVQRAQLVELNEQCVRQVARYFNLPPSKLGVADSISYNSFSQSQIQYVTGCLSHWFAAIAGECEIKLLSEAEKAKGSHYFEHNITKLIEADYVTLTEVLVKLRAAEVVNANEIRRKLNMPLRDDPAGETYTNPNTTPGRPSQHQPEENPQAPGGGQSEAGDQPGTNGQPRSRHAWVA